MWTIYVLQLEGDPARFYVGRTRNLGRRLLAHWEGRGCVFTKRHPPRRVVHKKEAQNLDGYDEDAWVKRYMELYGIDYVRGGSYSSVELTRGQRKLLKLQLSGAQDHCFQCDEQGHFAKNCTNKNNDNANEESEQTFSCFYCGRKGHYAADCRHPLTVAKSQQVLQKRTLIRNPNKRIAEMEQSIGDIFVNAKKRPCLSNEIQGSRTTAKCFRCGSNQHFIAECVTKIST